MTRLMQVMLTAEADRPLFGVRAVDIPTPDHPEWMQTNQPRIYHDRRLYLVGFDTAEKRAAWIAGHGFEVVT